MSHGLSNDNLETTFPPATRDTFLLRGNTAAANQVQELTACAPRERSESDDDLEQCQDNIQTTCQGVESTHIVSLTHAIAVHMRRCRMSRKKARQKSVVRVKFRKV